MDVKMCGTLYHGCCALKHASQKYPNRFGSYIAQERHLIEAFAPVHKYTHEHRLGIVGGGKTVMKVTLLR